MADTTTPGETAYAAYVLARYGMPAPDAALTYAASIAEERTAWEAAAQAVRKDTTIFQFALGQRVRRDGEGPTSVWRIVWRSLHEDPNEIVIWYGIKVVDPAIDYHSVRTSDGTDLSPVSTPPKHRSALG